MPVGDAMHRGDLVRRIENLERKIQELTSSRRLENASVGAGGIRLTGSRVTVTDALSAQEVARLGILDDGSQGLEIVDPDTGVPVSLHTILFGLRSARIRGAGETAGPNVIQIAEWVDADDEPGPSVTVRTGRTGLARVQISARMGGDSSLGVGAAQMSFEVTGATTYEAGYWGYAELSAETSAVVRATVSQSFIVTRLNPGIHTFACKYAAIPFGTSRFTGRQIDVQPL